MSFYYFGNFDFSNLRRTFAKNFTKFVKDFCKKSGIETSNLQVKSCFSTVHNRLYNVIAILYYVSYEWPIQNFGETKQQIRPP